MPPIVSSTAFSSMREKSPLLSLVRFLCSGSVFSERGLVFQRARAGAARPLPRSCRTYVAAVLEVQEQTVVARTGHLGVESDLRARRGPRRRPVAVRVDVQVGQVAVAQRDQVAVGAQVGLQVVDRLAVLVTFRVSCSRGRSSSRRGSPCSRPPRRCGRPAAAPRLQSPGARRSAPRVSVSPPVGAKSAKARRRRLGQLQLTNQTPFG